MTIVKRYVVFETLKVFLVMIGITLLLMTLGGGIKEGMKRGLPLPTVVQTIPFIMSEMLRFVVPGCLLFAVCSTFGRMSASNEIVAVKSLGIDPLKLAWPVFILACLMSVFTVFLYDICASWARPGLRQLVAESFDQIVYGVLRNEGVFASNGMSIYVKDVQDDRLLQPTITMAETETRPAVMMSAMEARLKIDVETGGLSLECTRGELNVMGEANVFFPDSIRHEVVLNEPDPNPENQMSPAALPANMIRPQIRREEENVRSLSAKRAALTSSDPQIVEALDFELGYSKTRLNRLHAEVPRRASNGFACLCFTLIGVPIAIWKKSSDNMSVFFVCFLPILLIYYPLLVLGENLARDGFAPMISVWLADVVLVIISVFLLNKVMGH